MPSRPSSRQKGDATGGLLLALARGTDVSSPENLDPHLKALASKHGLHLALAQSCSSSSGLGKALAPTLHSAIARQTVMRSHLRRLLKRFAEAGIPATPLKGPFVADLFYADPSVRPFTDLDLLVPSERLSEALGLIEADPYVPFIPPKRPEADKRDIPIFDPSGLGFSLDLHWDLFSYTQLRGAAHGATSEAWRRATFVHGPLGPRYEFPIEVTLAFLCLHALLDHRFRLILFRDLAEVVRRVDDWEPFVSFVTKWNLRSYSYISLGLARQYTGAEIPQEVMERLRPRYLLMSAARQMLGRIDIVHFDGHQTHPLNLVLVLLHDRQRDRAALASRAPFSYGGWKRRVEADTGPSLSPPSLMILVSSDRRRGAEVFGERLAEGLRERGWLVDLVSLWSEASEPRINSKVLKPTGRSEGRFDLRLAYSLRKRIRELKPDIVFANGGATLRHAAVALLGPTKSALVYGSIGDPAYWMTETKLFLLHKRLHRRAELVLAVSEHTRSSLISLFDLADSDVVVTPTGVPEWFFTDRIVEDNPELRLLFLGNISEEKDPQAALDLARNPGLRHRVKLRLVGNGPLLETMRSRTAALGLANVEFTGSVEDVLPHLVWADVLVLPSRTEGLPGSVMEAAAAGVPAVAYDVGGTSELAIDEETGLLVSPGDMNGLIGAVARLADDRDLVRMLGDSARRHVAERYSMEASIGRYDQALRHLLLRRVKA